MEETLPQTLPQILPSPPPDDFSTGYAALIGLRLVEWREGFARMEVAADARHLNRQGLVHGGILATMLDAAGGFAGGFAGDGSFGLPRVTLSLSINYIEGAREGLLTCVGRRSGGGRRSYSSTAEVRDAEGRLLATGQMVYRLFSPPKG